MPLKELPAAGAAGVRPVRADPGGPGGAARHPDWQILEKLKTDGFYLLLPDVQQMRALARRSPVRFRAEVALGRFDDAIRTAQTMFAMSRHLGEHPTLIGDLVGIAIAAIAIGPARGDARPARLPNLYWALTNLPVPLVSLRTGIEGERTIVLAEFRDLDRRPSDEPGADQEVHRSHGHAPQRLGCGQAGEGRAGLAGRPGQGRGEGRPPPADAWSRAACRRSGSGGSRRNRSCSWTSSASTKSVATTP